MLLKNVMSSLVNKCTHVRCISSSSASVTKIHRAVYTRTYPTIVVLPNGASINVRYSEPRKIIKVFISRSIELNYLLILFYSSH